MSEYIRPEDRCEQARALSAPAREAVRLAVPPRPQSARAAGGEGSEDEHAHGSRVDGASMALGAALASTLSRLNQPAGE